MRILRTTWNQPYPENLTVNFLHNNSFSFFSNLTLQLDCDETNIPFYPWGVVREAEYILRDHDQTYPLFLQVNFPQLRADYPEQVPKEYLDKVSRIPSEARRVYAGIVVFLSVIDLFSIIFKLWKGITCDPPI